MSNQLVKWKILYFTFGIMECKYLFVNQILLIAKKYIYSCRCNKTKPSITILNAKGRFTRYDFVACDNGLRQAHDMIYDCCVRLQKCRSILKHVLKRCDNRKVMS